VEKPSCPCCGTAMEVEDRGAKVLVRCPSCGLDELRLKP
jgi:predicted RNA-binding Zn-ribbon protein involved in translation (DUF1610 family)